MQFLDLELFLERKGEFDQAVRMTPGIPDFCSGSRWALAAHETLRDENFRKIPPLIVEENGHWLLFAQRPVNQGTYYFEPFEGHWLFTCPLIGPDPEYSLDLLSRCVQKLQSEKSVCFLVGGVPVGEDLDGLLEKPTPEFHVIQKVEGIPSMWIDLSQGLEGFLKNRSASFRKKIKMAQRKLSSTPVDFIEYQHYSEELFTRLLKIEEQCWKHKQGESIFQEYTFVQFYLHMMQSASDSSDLRFMIAQFEGRDIGYIMGSRFFDTYRGWQMSYDDEFRHLSIGNLLQIENIYRRAQEGVTLYDLGMHAEYKERWTDEIRDLNIYVLMFPPSR